MEVRRSLEVVDLNTVLILFRPINDLSAEQEVTGSVERMWSNSLILGNRQLA